MKTTFRNKFTACLLVGGILVMGGARAASSNFSAGNGIYGGLGMIYGTGEMDNELNVTAIETNDNMTTLPLSATLDMHGFGGAILAGLGKRFNNDFYIGVEGQAIDQNTQISEASLAGTLIGITLLKTATEVQQHYTLAAILRVGAYVKEHSLLYIKGGVAETQFEVKSEAQTESDPIDNIQVHKNTNVMGYVLGLGIEQPILCHLSVRAEDFFTWYNNFNIHQQGTFFAPPDDQVTTAFNSKFSPQTNTAMIALIYTI